MIDFLEKILNKAIDYFGLPVNKPFKGLLLKLGLEEEKFKKFESPSLLNHNKVFQDKPKTILRNIDILNRFPDISKKPITELTIILTHKCNLACAYCLRNANFNWQLEIPYRKLERIILSSHRLGCRQAGITGGEPFLYSSWPDLIELLGTLKWRVLWETNGLLINEKILQFIQKNLEGRFTFLVSLDSHKKEIHDKLRGKGSFEKAVSAIKLIKSFNFPLRANAIVTPLTMMTEKDLIDYVNFNKELGVNSLSINRVVALGRGHNQELFSLSEAQVEEIQAIIKKHNFFDGYLKGGAFHFIEEDQGCKRIGKELCFSPFGIHPCIFQENVKIAELDDFENLIWGNFLGSLDALRLASMSGYRGRFFSCADCLKTMPQYLKNIKNLELIDI